MAERANRDRLCARPELDKAAKEPGEGAEGHQSEQPGPEQRPAPPGRGDRVGPRQPGPGTRAARPRGQRAAHAVQHREPCPRAAARWQDRRGDRSYEVFLGMRGQSDGWEPQQYWFHAHVHSPSSTWPARRERRRAASSSSSWTCGSPPTRSAGAARKRGSSWPAGLMNVAWGGGGEPRSPPLASAPSEEFRPLSLAYVLFLEATTIPASPVPRSSKVAGSGTWA